jgi:hypothetical protein
VRSMVLREDSIRPILRHQDEVPVLHAESIAKFPLQAPQADRRAVAPGSQIVGIDGEGERHGFTR